MAGSTDVMVKFLADTDPFRKETEKVKGQTNKIKGWMKGVGLAIGGAFAVKAVGDWVTAAQEAESVSRKLKTTFKNAGDATGEWAEHAEKLADSMARKIGVDDEAIKGAQILLSTSKGLSSTLKDQPAIFDRATEAAADLSAAGFGNLEGAAKALTKAFEDPEKGLGALRKAGINFTEDEKKVIQSFIDSGDKAGAYNLILEKVEGKVGGVAESSATAGAKMKVAWGEAQEALGKALLPALEKVTPWVEKLAIFVEKNAAWLIPMTVGVVALVIGLKLWIGAQTILNGLLAGFGVEVGIATAPILLITAAVIGAYAAVVVLYAKWDQVWTAIGTMPWYAKVGLAILVLTNPVLLLIAAAAALGVYWDVVWTAIKNIIGSTIGPVVAGVEWLTDKLMILIDALDRAAGALGKFRDLGGFSSGGALAEAGRAAQGSGGGGDLQGFWRRIPGFATGGIVRQPTLALIGEAGPEAVVPLARSGTMPGLGTVNIYVTTTGLGASSPQIQSAVAAALRNYTDRNGAI